MERSFLPNWQERGGVLGTAPGLVLLQFCSFWSMNKQEVFMSLFRLRSGRISSRDRAATKLRTELESSLGRAACARSTKLARRSSSQRSCPAHIDADPVQQTLVRRGFAGFTLLELMVVMVVLTIVSTATMSRLGLQSADRIFRRYSADVYDTILSAQSRAVDDQTKIFLTIESDGVTLAWTDPDTGAREPLWSYTLENYRGGLLKDSTCNGGIEGVVPPGETEEKQTFSCQSGTKELLFLPDGTFKLLGSQNSSAGLTLVLARNLPSGSKRTATVIEVFPGGNIRKRDNVIF